MSKAVTACGATARETLGCELAEEVLRSSGKLHLRATGASMLPAVWPGDILSVRSHDATEALPGDIVLFAREGRLVVHRVVERTLCQDRIQWVTRGDSVEGNDPPISSHELLGRVTAIVRGHRRLTPHQSVASRLASWILCRSDLTTRVLLRLRGWVLGTGGWGYVPPRSVLEIRERDAVREILSPPIGAPVPWRRGSRCASPTGNRRRAHEHVFETRALTCGKVQSTQGQKMQQEDKNQKRPERARVI
jgi:signal peptidase I